MDYRFFLDFLSHAKALRRKGFFFFLLSPYCCSFIHCCPSPDGSENPLAFSFKKLKIVAHSGK